MSGLTDNRLDDVTERRIFNVTDAGIAHGFASDGDGCDGMREAEDALRKRIRELVGEARSDTRVHDYWCAKYTHGDRCDCAARVGA